MGLFKNPPAPLPQPEEDEGPKDETEPLPGKLLVLACILFFINTPENDDDDTAAVPPPVDTNTPCSFALLVA